MQTWTKSKVELQPWQAIPERMAQFELTDEDGMEQAWFVDEYGRLSGGAEAVNQTMKYIVWAKPLTMLYAIPGIRQLEDKAYHWVADNRHRLPGGTPACKLRS